jgi:hypothetical protein
LSSDLQFKFESSEKKSIKQTKSNSYSKQFYNYAKTEHVALHHKKFREKNKYTLSSVKEDTRKNIGLSSVCQITLGKVNGR